MHFNRGGKVFRKTKGKINVILLYIYNMFLCIITLHKKLLALLEVIFFYFIIQSTPTDF